MSAIDDKIGEFNVTISVKESQVTNYINELKARIAELEAQATEPGASVAQLEELRARTATIGNTVLP